MAKVKASFKEFLLSVAPEYQEFVEKLNDRLIEQGCDLVIKPAKSGYAASYQLEKKTVMNLKNIKLKNYWTARMLKTFYIAFKN